MRFIAITLWLLATAKVATLQWLYRASSDDVIVSAYRPRALDACSRDAHSVTLGLDGKAWTAVAPVRLEIGKPISGVYIWQVDQPTWQQRYRNPYLLLTAGTPMARLRCEFDIVNGTAVVSRI